ncbi:MAG: polyprenyl synthetase family protein [Syntrophales bacterium]|nr:polyprenyl synthetase family protein [Syntrophales bacterium]
MTFTEFNAIRISMNFQDVLDSLQLDLNIVESWLIKSLNSDVALIPEIGHYIIGSGGKRFRPLLLLAAARLCGCCDERIYPLSAVVEFIHTATLLHDDVVDGADTRRGKTSVNFIWGNAASVLVGDYLYSKAFQLATKHGNMAILNLLAEITNSMAEGEVLQLAKLGNIHLTEAEYLNIIEKKTAHLMGATCTIGAMLNGENEIKISALRDFGTNIGCAFQIIDDTLDYIAEDKEWGKSLGKDIEEGKVTLPLIVTLGRCQPKEKSFIKKVIQERRNLKEELKEIATLVNKYGGISYAVCRASEFVQAGKKALGAFPNSEFREAMFVLADFVLERRK